MKIGYPCINRTLTCHANKTFRLRSYSTTRLLETVDNNLRCLKKILAYNVQHGILFFRISSDLVPFASHPVNTFAWQKYFRAEFRRIGRFIKQNRIRISMHPDQFTLINSPKRMIFNASRRELLYHAQLLDLMRLTVAQKIQIHVGGVYNDKRRSINRFIQRYSGLDNCIQRRLIIENDDRNYTVRDCIYIHEHTRIPVLLDIFHHRLNNDGTDMQTALSKIAQTWHYLDGVPMIDFSHQQPSAKNGKHAEHIDAHQFKAFLRKTREYDFDVMLEIKDKERSALTALHCAYHDERLLRL
jgi:UV DNA damage endonuclease